MEQPISSLSAGQPFTLSFFTTGRRVRGRVITLGACSALVEWDPTKRTAFVHDRNGEAKEISISSRKREHIALSTPVERCEA